MDIVRFKARISCRFLRTISRSRRTDSTRKSTCCLAAFDARTSGDAGVPATREIRSLGLRATVARRVLINPPENARETRSSRETSSSMRSSSRRRNPRASRDVSIGSRGKRRLAGEESLKGIREITLRDAELFLGIPLAHRYAFPLEGLVIDGDRERRPDLVDSSIASPDRPGVVVEGCDPFSHGRPQGLGPFRNAVLADEMENGERDGGDSCRQSEDEAVPLRFV